MKMPNISDKTGSVTTLVKAFVANSPVAYIILDRQFRIHYINDSFLQLRNLDRDKAQGELCYNLSNGGQMCSVCAVSRAMQSGHREHILRKDVLPDGRVRYLDDYAIPLFQDEEGTSDYILEIMVDRSGEMNAREEMKSQFHELIRTLSSMLETKDRYTATHSAAVSRISLKIAQELGLSGKELELIEIAANLHDLGKVMIDSEVLSKPTKLTLDEYDQIKMHPVYSFEIIKDLTGFQQVKEYVLCHHERFDGKGYPNGLIGEDIPLGARIIAIADAYDAMTSSRPYRDKLSHEAAMAEICRCSGTQFDPVMVDAFLRTDPQTRYVPRIAAMNPHAMITRQISDHPVTQKKTVTDISELFSEEHICSEIIKETPIAYALLNSEYEVIYSSGHFRRIFKYADPGTKCFEASGFKEKCENCPVMQCLASNKMEKLEMVRIVEGKTRYFLCYALPVKGVNGDDYVIEILMDHTKEELMQRQMRMDYQTIIYVLSQLIVSSNPVSLEKLKFLHRICNVLCAEAGVSAEERQDILAAAALCDIEMIFGHEDEQNSGRILGNLSSLSKVQEILRHHQERYSGGGYPSGLSGDQIPLGSRMIYLAHWYFVRQSQYGHTAAMWDILMDKEDQFDPELTAMFMRRFWKGIFNTGTPLQGHLSAV